MVALPVAGSIAFAAPSASGATGRGHSSAAGTSADMECREECAQQSMARVHRLQASGFNSVMYTGEAVVRRYR